ELPLDRVKIFHGSTTYLRDGVGAFGSRSTVMGGSAIVLAAEALIAKFRAAAAEKFGVAIADVGVVEGVAVTSDGRKLELVEGLAVDAEFRNSKATYSYGSTIAHVAVDPATGAVDVLDLVTVDDVGRVINPLTLHGQVIGATVQGLGSVLSEEIRYDASGQPLVGSLADYLIPVATDYPNVTTISLEEHPSPNNPLGAKGAGEGGIIPIGGAVANAVASALKSLAIEPRELPLSPPRVWQLIADARAKS